MSEKLKIGKITGAQGLRGEVKLYHYSGDADALWRLTRIYLDEEYTIEGLRYRGRTSILKLVGVDNRDSAEALVGSEVYSDKEESRPKEEGAWFVSDLIGLEVRLGGETIGHIKNIIDNPVHDILEIERNDEAGGRPALLLPFIDIFVPEVNPDAGFININPPEGWLHT